MYDICRAVHFEAGPFLHGGAIDVLLVMLVDVVSEGLRSKVRFGRRSWATYVKGHPGDGLVVRDISPLDEFQGQCFIVELEGEDGTWWCPGAAHQVVKHAERGCGVEATTVVGYV